MGYCSKIQYKPFGCLPEKRSSHNLRQSFTYLTQMQSWRHVNVLSLFQYWLFLRNCESCSAASGSSFHTSARCHPISVEKINSLEFLYILIFINPINVKIFKYIVNKHFCHWILRCSFCLQIIFLKNLYFTFPLTGRGSYLLT